MARLTTLQKAERTVKLLLGMRIPRVAQHLEPYGFRRATLEQGWARVLALSLGSVEHLPLPGERGAVPGALPGAGSARPLTELDAFENTWFPIARRSLGHRYPKVAEHLFDNVIQSRGVGSAITVMHFLERLAAMERGEEPFGAEGPAARRLLRERGLSKKKENAARDVITRLRQIESASRIPIVSAQDEARAAEAMWAWYLEWSAIARVAIKNRTLLKALGFAPRPPRAAEQKPESVTVTVRESRDLPPRSGSQSHLLGPSQRRTKRLEK